MASSRREKNATLVWAAIPRAVILEPVNSQPGQCVTRVVQLVVRVIAGWLRQRNYAGSPGMVDAMSPSFAPEIRQRVRRISLRQTVRADFSFSSGGSHISLRPGLWEWRACVCQRRLHIIGPWVSVFCKFALTGAHHASVQCRSAGSTLGLVKTCAAKNDRSCQVSCQDPRTPNQCIVLQTLLVDGSPCGAHNMTYRGEFVAEVTVAIGYGGTCLSGSCHSGSAWDVFQVRHPCSCFADVEVLT